MINNAFLPEINDIYFPATREYMKEVITSYSIGNYRSAIVMLYSVALYDIVLKLQELKAMYNDSTASDILDNMKKNQSNSKSKSSWEKDLLKDTHEKTKLLNNSALVNLEHLYDHRNFCAHPAMNKDFELFFPRKEVVLAHIVNILTDVLVKPPIFIKNIIDQMTDDLEKNREIYKNNIGGLKTFLENKYYSKMDTEIVDKVFSTFWKFCFCKDSNEQCRTNITINRQALSILYESNKSYLLEKIKTEKDRFSVSNDKDFILSFTVFLSDYCGVYSVLSDNVKNQIDWAINEFNDAKAISWFKSGDLESHIDVLKECFFEHHDDSYGFDEAKISQQFMNLIEKKYEDSGKIKRLLDLYITFFAESCSFDDANSKYEKFIEPQLSKFTFSQFETLIGAINKNYQIYSRNKSVGCNHEIVEFAKKRFKNDFEQLDISQYPNFEL